MSLYDPIVGFAEKGEVREDKGFETEKFGISDLNEWNAKAMEVATKFNESWWERMKIRFKVFIRAEHI